MDAITLASHQTLLSVCNNTGMERGLVRNGLAYISHVG